MEKLLHDILDQFLFEGIVSKISRLDDGLINDTFLIKTIGNSPDYILQRKNKNVFRDIHAMMENIDKITLHLKNKIASREGDPMKEVLTLVKTKEGANYYLDKDGEYWAACVFIDDTVIYEKVESIDIAFQGGKVIGYFQAMLSDFTDPLTDILPGFHNISYRFDQWDETIRKDASGRKKLVLQEIEWIESYRKEMLDFWKKVEDGALPVRVTHNDTKINNILFDKSSLSLCVIDLDTVLNSVCINDYGDAIRSYANAGKEDEEILDNVYLKKDIFEAFTKGYLSEALAFLTPDEIKYLVFSAKYIVFEQTLRFLMDYIDGDMYYKVKSQDHNLIRARAQYKLLMSIEDNYSYMQAFIEQIVGKND